MNTQLRQRDFSLFTPKKSPRVRHVIDGYSQDTNNLSMADLNRVKNVLAERGFMSKWLAKTLHKDPATVSKWCNNHAQPDLKTLAQIAEVLNVDIHELICHTKAE